MKRNLRIGNIEVEASIKGFSSLLNLNATRLFFETQLFSKIAVDSIIAYKFMIFANLKLRGNEAVIEAQQTLTNIDNLIQSFDIGLAGIKSLFANIKKLPEMFQTLKIAKENFLLTNELIIDNIEDAKILWKDLQGELKKQLNQEK